MSTSSRIRECIDYLTRAYYDLSKYPKNDKYHWVIKGQISDKEFELDGLLSELDVYEAHYGRCEAERVARDHAKLFPKPPAG